jgi:hypothetical protein
MVKYYYHPHDQESQRQIRGVTFSDPRCSVVNHVT